MVFGACGTVLKQMGILRTVAMPKTIITLATLRTLTLLKTSVPSKVQKLRKF